MPYYRIIITSAANEHRGPGWSQIEHCSAADVDTVNLIAQRDISRYDDASLYKWTVSEAPEPPKRTRAPR
jgi:hypothetical protein